MAQSKHSDTFSRIFSTRAFDLDDDDDDDYESYESEYYDTYYDLNSTRITSNSTVNFSLPRFNHQSNQPPPPPKPPIYLSPAKPSDALALLRVRINSFPIHYSCRKVPKPLYLSSILSKISAELKVSAENPKKNVVVKAMERGRGSVVGYCLWGFAGVESRELDDRAKVKIRSPEGYDRGWLREYVGVFGGFEEKTVPEEYFLVMEIAVMSDYQRRGIGTLLLNWGLRKADAEMKPVHAITSPKGEELFAKLGFKSIERRILPNEIIMEGCEEDARTSCAMIRQPVSAAEWKEREQIKEVREASLEGIKKRRLEREERRESLYSVGKGADAEILTTNSLRRTSHVKKVKGGVGEFGFQRSSTNSLRRTSHVNKVRSGTAEFGLPRRRTGLEGELERGRRER